MKWYYGLGARYNTKFAKAVVKAKLASREKFRFMKKTYVVADHIKGVLEDLEEKRYAIVL